MDKGLRAHIEGLKINHYQPSKLPWRRMGQYLYRIIEDGSNTEMRLSAIESLLPPHSGGPVVHFHEMHDECFYVIKGKVRFHSPGRPDIDAVPGEMVVLPVRMPHKFSNPFDEEAVFININTPGFYVRYFQYLEELVGEGLTLTPEINKAAMSRFGTVPMSPEAVALLEGKDLNSLGDVYAGSSAKMAATAFNGGAVNGAPKDAAPNGAAANGTAPAAEQTKPAVPANGEAVNGVNGHAEPAPPVQA